MSPDPETAPPLLPEPFSTWFAEQGWRPHAYQLELVRRTALNANLDRPQADLLVAPTGGGKTLAGFLPSLIDLASKPPDPARGRTRRGLHTLYISPLKALAADIRRNLERPVAEMQLPIRVEDRTGDTTSAQRARQRVDPPDLLLTTPESLAILCAQEHAPRLFGSLAAVIVDEAHALAGAKRGDQLALCLARLRSLAPAHRRIGLSATTEDPEALAHWLEPGACSVLFAPPGPRPEIRILETAGDPPWSGMGGRYAAAAVMREIEAAQTALVFINTRAQAELFFQELWRHNDANLPIALHHGSLGRETRLKVEAAMAEGQLRAVVATSSLDLGVDWASVDLVIQVGAPKGVKRLVQRIGRANHRFDAPSRAILVPANRFEVIECRAALEAVEAGELDGEPSAPGTLDTLCQHLLLIACAGPFDADDMYAEIRQAGPYSDLARADFDRCLDFCATGGYALRAYDRWRRLMQGPDGLWRLRDPRSAQRIKMNVGTIVEAETLKVRMGRRGGGPQLGEVEESFAATLRSGDTFLIGGRVVRYEGLHEMTVVVSNAEGREPRIPVFSGGTLPISTFLAHRVLDRLNSPEDWAILPGPVAEWLTIQDRVSEMPRADRLLVETFPRAGRHFLVAWGFAGRNAHQTLGLILSKRLEDSGLAPLGFVATDYALMVWGLDAMEEPAWMFEPDGLRDGLEQWLTGSAVMKRTFRQAAVVAGLIERRMPGKRKTGRQATFSSDILYDTLARYEPNHLMMDITRRAAMTGMVDFERIEEMLRRIGAGEGVRWRPLTRMSPLAAPLMLEVGRVPIKGGDAEERLLAAEEQAAILRDALSSQSP